MRTNFCSLFTGVLAGAALFVQPLSVVAAPAAGAQLPDWDAAKPKPKPADLPDWDAAKPKPKDPKKPKKHRGEKPAEATPTETPAETPPAETPTETPPAEATPTETPPVVETPPPVVETPPPAVETPPPAAEGPEPAPAVDTGSSKEAQKIAKREIIAGAALLGLGIGGLGMMGAGFAIKGNKNATEAEYDRGVTILSAGAIIGTIGTIMGLALLGDGIKDRKAARPKAQARVMPTFGGLAISGRF